MDWLRFFEILAAALCLATAAIACWHYANDPANYLWKRELILLTGAIAGGAFCTIGLAQHLYDLQVPHIHVSGKIVGGGWTQGRTDLSQDVRVLTDEGTLVTLHRPHDTDINFQTDRRLQADYVTSTNALISATIFTETGFAIERYNNTKLFPNPWRAVGLWIGGLVFLFAIPDPRRSDNPTTEDYVVEALTNGAVPRIS